MLSFCLLGGYASGTTEITGGWSASGDSIGEASGESYLSSSGGDPSITMAISSMSSVYGAGSFKDSRTGSQSISVPIGTFTLSARYSGTVSTSTSLTTPGSASTSAYVGATATGITTGNSSYDIFGSADLLTSGYMSGRGSGLATASGSSSYNVSRLGTQSEVWGQVAGQSITSLQGLSAGSLVSTSGQNNGLHTESRTRNTINGGVDSRSNSQITSYASALNNAKSNVSASGTAQSGVWDVTFSGTKSWLGNENVASSTTGNLKGYVESNGDNDAADSDSILQANASRSLTYMAVSGGPGTYASGYKTSSARRTYADSWVNNATWGSVVRFGGSRTAIEWGSIATMGSGAQSYQSGAGATSFGKVLMGIDYTIASSKSTSTGTMTVDTFADATKNMSAISGSVIGPVGQSTAISTDVAMTNELSFILGDRNHYSFVDASRPFAETHANLDLARVSTNPRGNESLTQPFVVSTIVDPNVAWSRTMGSFVNSH